MGNFDVKVFVHAFYVAFVYGMLAFGASAYRRIVDNLANKSVRLGEDMYYGYDPLVFLGLGVMTLVDMLFIWLALWMFDPEVHYYVIPLAITINIIQVAQRMHYQRLQIKTRGIVGKNIFAEDFQIVEYDQMFLVEVERDSLWNTVTFHFARLATATDEDDNLPPPRTEPLTCKRRVSRRTLDELLTALRSRSRATIIDKDAPPLPPSAPPSV